MRFIYAFVIFSFFFTSVGHAQEKRELIQFSGVLVSADSLDQVSYASVVDKTTGKGTMSDYYGYFSFVTRPGDTILFNAFGFKTSSYIVPDSLKEIRYSIIHVMTPDTLLLPEVDIYPRSEEHTSELQLRPHLVCRLLLEKKKKETTERCLLKTNTQ